MPIEYEVDDGVLWLRTFGEVDYDDGVAALTGAIEAARARGGGPRRWPVVFDIHASRELPEAEEIHAFAQFVAQHLDVLDAECAVISGNDMLYGVARMFGAYAETYGLTVTVFRSPEEITDWLAARTAGGE